jgi:GNAT superfamily N-acetyltransferase
MIDTLKETDLERIRELNLQLGYTTSLAELRTRLSGLAGRRDHALFVFRDGSMIAIGYVHVLIEPPSLLADARAEIHTLVVDEVSRGKSVGKKLLEKAETWAKENSVAGVRLRSNIKRERAHKFYERCGYEISKTSYIFTKIWS